MKKELSVFLAVIMMLSALTCIASAAGSASQMKYSLTKKDGATSYTRGYLEFAATGITGEPTAYMSGVLRQQVIYAYIKKGESAYFGSSIADSMLDDENKFVNKVTGCDIAVVKPDGTKMLFDINASTGEGYITTNEQELEGPNINGYTPLGYKPLSFIAEETGIYTFYFHSKKGKGFAAGENPTATSFYDAKGKDSPTKNTNYTVDRWDLTIADSNRIIPGRMYTYYISTNMGANNRKYAMEYYLLTDDGYCYRVDFNNCDPWGFILFANNRGLINVSDDSTAYHSARVTENNLRDLGMTEDYIDSKGVAHPTPGLTFHSPATPDTIEDETFRFFFEEPDPELEGILAPVPYEPEPAKNLSFKGFVDENTTISEVGGTFTFEITEAESVTIQIDLSNLKRYDEEKSEWVTENHGVAEISDSVFLGKNSIIWDGLDGNGEPLPLGKYDKDSIGIRIETHMGEYHIPFFDVEGNPGGISVERINKIYSRETGEDVTAHYDADKYLVHYDNSDHYGNYCGKNIGDGVNASHGVNSQRTSSGIGAMPYKTGTNMTYGDRTAIDVWTYSRSIRTYTLNSFGGTTLEFKENKYTAVKGNVFYDENNNGVYSILEGDYNLPDIKVKFDYSYHDPETGEFVEKTQILYTDNKGNYYSPSFPLDKTTAYADSNVQYANVTIIKPYDFYEVTTSNGLTESAVLKPGYVEIGRRGLFYEGPVTSMTLSKDWKVHSVFDANRPNEIFATVSGGYDNDGIWTPVYSREVILEELLNWTMPVPYLPLQIEVDGSLKDITYRVTKEEFTTLDGKFWSISYDEASPTGYGYHTSFETVLNDDGTYTALIINAPRTVEFEITKHAKYTNEPLAGAEYSLYINTAENEYKFSGTYTTDENGESLILGLKPGRKYILIETKAPEGYLIDSALFEFIADETFAHTFFNTKDCNYFDHEYVERGHIPSNCTEEGKIIYVCDNCGDEKEDVIPPHGHDWDDGIITKEPTCTEEGEKKYTCSYDDSHVYYEPLLKKEHADNDDDGACDGCGTILKEKGKLIPVIFFAPDNISYKLDAGVEYYLSPLDKRPIVSNGSSSFHDSTTVYVEEGTVIRFKAMTFLASYTDGYAVTVKSGDNSSVLPYTATADDEGFYSFKVEKLYNFVSMAPIVNNPVSGEKQPWYQFLIDFFNKIINFFKGFGK